MLPNDPNMLLSLVNLKLRDNYSSLEDMIDDMDLDPVELQEKLDKSGIIYDPATNQLKYK